MSERNPAVILYDAAGNPMPIAAGVAVGTTRGLVIAGSDGTNARFPNVDANGALRLQEAGTPGSAVPTRAVQMGGSDGTNLRALLSDTKGVQACMTLQQAIQMGLYTGGRAGFSFGRRLYVSTTAMSSIVRNTYTEPAAGSLWKVASSVAADAAAGTGARKLIIVYYVVNAGALDGPFQEEVTLNGVTDVTMTGSASSPNQPRFLEHAYISAVGSGAVAAGTITIKTNAGVTIATITAGELSLQNTIHYVASGKTCFIDAINARAVAVNFNVFPRVDNPLSRTGLYKVGLEFVPVSGNPSWTNLCPTPIKIPGPAVIEMTGVPLASSATAEAHSYFSWYEL